MKKAALVIMAAGMGSRYGGSKQVAGMGPNGEILMEYSIRDAIRAGFTKVVFIIKPDMLELMQNICGKKFADQIDVRYAFQDFSSVPAAVPEGRVKPFGTVHAVLCAREQVDEPFAVINADDFYGAEAFAGMYSFLTSPHAADCNCAAMMGYQLKNTVSENGVVTRGVCSADGEWLSHVREIKNIRLCPDGRIVNEADGEVLDPESCVSMNFWGFGSRVFEAMDAEFRRFLSEIEEGNLKAEYLLPVFVDEQLRRGAMRVRMLTTGAVWFGVTYQEDRPAVAAALKALHDQGVY